MPSAIEELHREFKDHSRGVSSTVVLDSTGEVAERYRVAYTPTVFLIDREGKVVGKAIGNKPWTSAAGRTLIRALLAR